MDEEMPFADDPAWLALPIQKRELALHRRDVILSYEMLEKPGDAEVQAAARALDMTASHFYRLVRRWRALRSVFSLVPFSKPGTQSHARLDPAVSDAVSKLVKSAINTDGDRSPTAILRKIQMEWDLPQKIPSHMTLRKSIAVALKDLHGLSENSITLSGSAVFQQIIGKAKRFGDFVAVDHTALDLFVAVPGGQEAPIVTFVIDLFTSSILGHHVSLTSPQPENVIEALRSAERRTRRFANDHFERVKPKIFFAATAGPEWNEFLKQLYLAQLDATFYKSRRLRFGAIIARLIGNEIGQVKLSHRKAHQQRVFDPKRDALVSLEQLDLLLQKGIDELNERRIPSDVQCRPLYFDL